MKRFFLAAGLALIACSISAQQKIDTIILPHPVYFTILGVGTEHAQVAIIGNVAPGEFSGVQAAGIFNVCTGPMNGLQIAGLSNHSLDSLNGVQAAGFLNTVHGNVRGLQASGAINFTDGDVMGAQLAGSLNVATGNVQRFQLSGGMNYAQDVNGLQIAGGTNIAAGTVRGLQISGGLNVAQNVKGIQLGVVNLADSADGAMIGLFSYAVHGYHKIELGWNETMPMNISFRTGSKKFHNIFASSFDPRSSQFTWAFGYGAGSSWPLSKRFDLGVDVVNYHVNKGRFSNSLSDFWKLNLTCDFHILNKLSVSAGPSLNVFITDLHPYSGETAVTGIVPYYFFAQTWDNRWNAKAWIGVNASIRLF